MTIDVEVHADCHVCGDCDATEALCSTCAADLDREWGRWWAPKARVAMRAALDVLQDFHKADTAVYFHKADTAVYTLVNASKVNRAARLLRDCLEEKGD